MNPLPIFLAAAVPPATSISLLDCYTAAIAWSSNLTYFAIVDGARCYGGDSLGALPGDGWVPTDGCPLDCAPGAPVPGACGGNNTATFFSMGACGESCHRVVVREGV